MVQTLPSPVLYFSQKLSPSEINYDVHNKELLAIIESFRDNRHWLIGSQFPISVITDHKHLSYFMQPQLLNQRQAHWAMFLSEFDFKLQWSPGTKNVTDAASRCPDYMPKKEDETLEVQL